jgi:hypothetical protein
METRKIKFVAHALEWFDRVKGNTYHSVRIIRCRDGKVLACPLTYGSGCQYHWTALAAMAKAKWLPPKYRPDGMAYERQNNYPILWIVGKGNKRECVANGTQPYIGQS